MFNFSNFLTGCIWYSISPSDLWHRGRAWSDRGANDSSAWRGPGPGWIGWQVVSNLIAAHLNPPRLPLNFWYFLAGFRTWNHDIKGTGCYPGGGGGCHHDLSIRTSPHQPVRMKNQIQIWPEPSVFELFVACPWADGQDPNGLGSIVYVYTYT